MLPATHYRNDVEGRFDFQIGPQDKKTQMCQTGANQHFTSRSGSDAGTELTVLVPPRRGVGRGCWCYTTTSRCCAKSAGPLIFSLKVQSPALKIMVLLCTCIAAMYFPFQRSTAPTDQAHTDAVALFGSGAPNQNSLVSAFPAGQMLSPKILGIGRGLTLFFVRLLCLIAGAQENPHGHISQEQSLRS